VEVFFCIEIKCCCAARSAFGRRAEPEQSEGGGVRRSVAVPNGEGVASGSATHHHIIPTFNVNIPNDIFGFHVFPPLAVLKALLFNFVIGIIVQ